MNSTSIATTQPLAQWGLKTAAVAVALLVSACATDDTATEASLADATPPTTASPQSFMPDTAAVAEELDAIVDFAFEEPEADGLGYASVGCPLLTWSPLLRTLWESGDAAGLEETLFSNTVGQAAFRVTGPGQPPMVLCDVYQSPDPASGILAVSIGWSRTPDDLSSWFDAIVADLVGPNAVGRLDPILDDVDQESLAGGTGTYSAGCAGGDEPLNDSCFVVWSDDEMVVTTWASGTTAEEIDLRPVALEFDRFLANTLDEV